jgi:hypothetical protein
LADHTSAHGAHLIPFRALHGETRARFRAVQRRRSAAHGHVRSSAAAKLRGCSQAPVHRYAVWASTDAPSTSTASPERSSSIPTAACSTSSHSTSPTASSRQCARSSTRKSSATSENPPTLAHSYAPVPKLKNALPTDAAAPPSAATQPLDGYGRLRLPDREPASGQAFPGDGFWGQGSRFLRETQGSWREGCVSQTKRRSWRKNAVGSAVPQSPSRRAKPPW